MAKPCIFTAILILSSCAFKNNPYRQTFLELPIDKQTNGTKNNYAGLTGSNAMKLMIF